MEELRTWGEEGPGCTPCAGSQRAVGDAASGG